MKVCVSEAFSSITLRIRPPLCPSKKPNGRARSECMARLRMFTSTRKAARCDSIPEAK